MQKAKLIPILSVLCALPAAARFPVIGYYASWSGGADAIQYGKLTHLNYAFAATGADAGLGGVDEGQLRDIVSRAHQAGTKVGVAVGGWGADQAFIAMAASAAGREKFAANAVAFCDRLGLDGIDIDWEFPLPSNADAYESLMKTLGAALHQKNRYLSVAVKSHDVYVADPEVGKNFKSGIFASVDFLNVMAYDGGGKIHAPYEMAQTEMQYWTVTRGCPRAKVILGVPFYGKELKSDGKEVATAYRDLPYADRQVASRDNSGAIWYNGAATIEKKARLAASVGGGVMIWEVAQDAHDETSLLGTIAKLAATFPDVPLAIAPARRASPPAAALPWFPVLDGRSFTVTGRALPVPPAR